jgi:tRNA uridine 5-carboxymethylaminomethyl modification enzyme
MEYGHETGLISEDEYKTFTKKKEDIQKLTNKLMSIKLTPKKETNEYLESLGSSKLLDSITLLNLLKRPEINYEDIKQYIDEEFSEEVIEQVVINTKYEGYIAKANKEAEKMIEYENIKLSEDIDYTKVPNLAKEASQKLNQIKPISIGQAIRISGVNPADITMLLLYLKRNKHE